MSKNKFKYALDDGTIVELTFSEIKKIINSKNSDIDFKECEKAFEFLLNEENKDIIKEKQELIKRLINDIYIISDKRKKEEEKLEKIKKLSIYDITNSQACLIGKSEEWWKLTTKLIEITNYIMPINVDYFSYFLEEQNLDESTVTPTFFVNLIKKYKDKSKEEILHDIKKIRKNSKKK